MRMRDSSKMAMLQGVLLSFFRAQHPQCQFVC
jgi:hypothetical protein